ncbi:MAG: hypothetical protein ABIJ59_11455 [Pseudomonadota bacterium]
MNPLPSKPSHQTGMLWFAKDLPNICSLAGLFCALLGIYFAVLKNFHAIKKAERYFFQKRYFFQLIPHMFWFILLI